MERSTRSATFIAQSIGSRAKAPPGWRGATCPPPHCLHTPFFWLKGNGPHTPGSLRTTRSLQASLLLHVGTEPAHAPALESHPLSPGAGAESKGLSAKGLRSGGDRFQETCSGALGPKWPGAEGLRDIESPAASTGTQFPQHVLSANLGESGAWRPRIQENLADSVNR